MQIGIISCPNPSLVCQVLRTNDLLPSYFSIFLMPFTQSISKVKSYLGSGGRGEHLENQHTQAWSQYMLPNICFPVQMLPVAPICMTSLRVASLIKSGQVLAKGP